MSCFSNDKGILKAEAISLLTPVFKERAPMIHGAGGNTVFQIATMNFYCCKVVWHSRDRFMQDLGPIDVESNANPLTCFSELINNPGSPASEHVQTQV